MAQKIERLRASLHRLDEPLQNRRTIFVSHEELSHELSPAVGSTPAEVAAAPPLRARGAAKRHKHAADGDTSGVAASSSGRDDEDEVMETASGNAKLSKKRRAQIERARAASYSELEQRVARHEQIGRTLQRISVEKALLGKGARRKIKGKEGAPKQYKFKQRRSK